MGSSKPWPEAMEKMTGQKRMDASALREYFQPLEDWLKAKNKEMGETPGWGLCKYKFDKYSLAVFNQRF